MKDENYIFKSFLIVLITTVVFSSLSVVDYDKFNFSIPIKPINLFSDIQHETDDIDDSFENDYNVFNDSTVLAEHSVTGKNSVYNDSATTSNEKYESRPLGLVDLQNYTDVDFPLDKFYAKLIAAKTHGAKVRVAWFGDSFTDADIVVSDLRDTLQSVYGGNGVGFVPITSEAPGFRMSVEHAFAGWNTKSVINKDGARNFGINGYSYKPDSANYVRFSGSRRFKHTKKFDIFRFFYVANRQFEAKVSLNDSMRKTVVLPQAVSPQMYSVTHNNIRKVKLSIPQTTGITLFGASLEDSTGIYIDNFSIKGNSGISLMSIPSMNLAKFDSLLNYDLIVLQFGLNAVSSQTRSYTDYMDAMARLIVKFRKAFPNTPILMLSVSDRSERLQGRYVTMKSIKGLVRAQEKLAADKKLLFWNLYEAMGGENSMARFVAANPPLANKDYTHLNFKGGRKIGLIFARSFIRDVKKYEERRDAVVTD